MPCGPWTPEPAHLVYQSGSRYRIHAAAPFRKGKSCRLHFVSQGIISPRWHLPSAQGLDRMKLFRRSELAEWEKCIERAIPALAEVWRSRFAGAVFFRCRAKAAVRARSEDHFSTEPSPHLRVAGRRPPGRDRLSGDGMRRRRNACHQACDSACGRRREAQFLCLSGRGSRPDVRQNPTVPGIQSGPPRRHRLPATLRALLPNPDSINP